MLLSTNSFAISSTTYVRRILKRWTSRHIFLLASAIVILLSLGIIINIAFLIVALMVIFIIIPTGLMFVYYFYALNPRIVMLSSGETTISLNHNHISTIVTHEERTPYEFQIQLSDVKSITPGELFDTIIYGNRLDEFILIDKKAFLSQTQRFQFHNYIFDYIQHNYATSQS